MATTLLAAKRQDEGHAVVDVGDRFVCLGGEDGEVDRIFLCSAEFGRFARVDASHREGLAGLERDAVGLFMFAGCLPLVVAVGSQHKQWRPLNELANISFSAAVSRRALIIGWECVLRFHSSGQKPQRASSMQPGLYVLMMGSICEGAEL